LEKNNQFNNDFNAYNIDEMNLDVEKSHSISDEVNNN